MAGKTVLRVRREDVVLVSWKRDFITVAIALALIMLVSHIYDTTCVDEEVQEEACQEEGPEMATGILGWFGPGDGWTEIPDGVMWGTGYPFVSGNPSRSFYDSFAGTPLTWPDPASLKATTPPYMHDEYILYNETSKIPLRGFAYLKCLKAKPEALNLSMAVYALDGTLKASAASLSIPSSITGWIEFPFTWAEALTDGVEYALVIGKRALSAENTVYIQGTTNFANYVAPVPPPPDVGGVVLPLIKGASDMAAGNSRLIQ